MPKTIAIKLFPKAETFVKKGHPWLFSDSIQKIPEDAQTGDIAIIFSNKDNKLIGVGLYDADSAIRIKLLDNKALKPDLLYFKNRIRTAFERRKTKIQKDTNAYRLIYGESDQLPSVIVDVYDRVVVVKLYSAIWFPYFNWITEALQALLQPQALVLRLARNLQNTHPNFQDGQIVLGSLEDEEVVFKEYGIRFKANVIQGHKTGYFLDHRYNRHQVGQMSKGKTVLDVFAYAGGFSVHALAGGAVAVSSVDISKQALEVAKSNVALNPSKGKHICITGDAFQILKDLVRSGKKYDIVVIDPPSFAKQQTEVNTALKKYQELAALGFQLCQKGGTLVLASCSSRILEKDFLYSHQLAFQKLSVRPKILLQTQHDWDHPIGISEMAYLKTVYYKV